MRGRRALVAATAAALVAAMGAGVAHGIVYGQPDEGEHPHVGSMVIHVHQFPPADGAEVYLQWCSGTHIEGADGDSLFLTAAHCVVGLEEFFEEAFGLGPDDYDVWVTFDEQISPSGTYFGGEIHAHPDFFTHGLADLFDVAVFDNLTLTQDGGGDLPGSFGQLPEPGLLDDMKKSGELKEQIFTAVGYGTVRETRRKAFANILPNEQRNKGDQEFLSLTKAWITLSMNEATDNAGTCYGDSGGPHFLEDSNVIVSLTVTGDAVCKATDKTYRLDTPSARGFLDAFVDLP